MTVFSSFYDYPVWTTPPYLGTFAQDYSFDLNPLIIFVGANPNTVITILNGSLPAGLKWTQVDNTVVISGAVIETSNNIDSHFTFRATQQNGTVADRTFLLNLTAIARAPSWNNQTTFLGYQSNISIVQYTLHATSESGNHILYDLPNHPGYANVNLQTGVFTLNANPFTSNVTVLTEVRATDSLTNTASNVNVTVNISTVHGPLWVTPAGSLGEFHSNDFVEINLVAEDPFSPTLPVYHLQSNQSTLNLSSAGLLYGTLPNVNTNTNYAINVIATSSNVSNNRLFSITNIPAIKNQEFYWATDSDLGSIDEGSIHTVSIRAITTRGTTILYNVTGGLLPPHMILGLTDGNLYGFVEYTAIDKIYYFDVTAYDGFQSIVRQFSLRVNKIFANQFINAYIPLTGSLRDRWITDSANIKVREPGKIIYDSITEIENYPSLEIISGLETGWATPQDIVHKIHPWFSQLTLQIGKAANTAVQSDGLSIIYRNIVDSQQGANVQITTSYIPPATVYPISISNIRNALIQNYPWVQDANGQGLLLSSNVDFDTGAVLSVDIIDSGVGYVSAPILTVTGAGIGAKLQAVLGAVSFNIINSGYGWSVGQIFTIFGFNAIEQALLKVTEITVHGGISAAEIVSGGNYQQVGTENVIPVQSGSSYAVISLTFGIVNVVVTEAGENYQCGINITVGDGELLPSWQNSYSPIITSGKIPVATAQLACNVLNTEQNTLYGELWQPNYLVLQWQGLTYIGTTIFDENTTTFDGDTTRFLETQSAHITVFDEQHTIFDNEVTIFDYQDPLMYDLQLVWGGTLIDAGTTVFDLYSTIFDTLRPRTYSNTRIQRWINTTNKIYSGNNAVT